MYKGPLYQLTKNNLGCEIAFLGKCDIKTTPHISVAKNCYDNCEMQNIWKNTLNSEDLCRVYTECLSLTLLPLNALCFLSAGPTISQAGFFLPLSFLLSVWASMLFISYIS